MVDIYNKAKKLHIEAEARRLVFVIETNKHRDSNAMEVMKSLFTGRHGAYITAVDEENIILVKELEKRDTYEEMHQLANDCRSVEYRSHDQCQNCLRYRCAEYQGYFQILQ